MRNNNHRRQQEKDKSSPPSTTTIIKHHPHCLTVTINNHQSVTTVDNKQQPSTTINNHQQIVSNYKKSPKKYLVDGGFTTVNDINELTNSGTIVFGALKNVEDQLDAGKNPYAKKPKDSQAMADFRARMGTKDAQEIYSKRASIAEFSNAECRNRGLSQFRVRGLIKAKAQVFWHVLAHNFNRFINLDYLKIFTRTNVPLTC